MMLNLYALKAERMCKPGRVVKRVLVTDDGFGAYIEQGRKVRYSIL